MVLSARDLGHKPDDLSDTLPNCNMKSHQESRSINHEELEGVYRYLQVRPGLRMPEALCSISTARFLPISPISYLLSLNAF